MPYHVVDTYDAHYKIIEKERYFVEFNAGTELLRIFEQHLQGISFKTKLLSERKGSGIRKESLYKVQFDDFRIPTSFIYAFQTESGGRWNSISKGMGEARMQWRTHDQWDKDLNIYTPAKKFCLGIRDSQPFTNCFIFSIFKRHINDEDIMLSAAYPAQAQDVEINSRSNKSIQFKILDLQDAYLSGISATEKNNDEYIVHFRPEKLLWYMQNRDEIHNSSTHYLKRILNNSKSK